MTGKEITREELYDLVWQRPISKLAPEFGTTPYWLRKICHDHDIPTAPNEWWFAKEYGRQAVQTPLPKDSQFAGQIISIPPGRPRPELSPERMEATAKATEATAKAKKITSTRALPQIAKDMIAELKGSEPNEHGSIHLDSPTSFKFSFNKAELPRVIEIISQLVPAVLELGFEIKSTDKGARIVAEGYEIPVYVRAFLKQVQVKSRWSLSGIGRAYLPSSRLAVILNDLGGREGRYGFGDRKEFADKARYRVEDKIQDVIAAIALEPVRRREDEEQRRRWREERAEEERQRKHADWLKHRETLRHDLLNSLTAANHERHEIRALLETLPTKCRKNDPRYAAFIRWSKRRLQSLDDQLSADAIVGRLRKRRLFEAENDAKA